MDAERLAFSDEVIRKIKQLAKVIFNATSSVQLESMFGVTQEQLNIIIRKIVIALPDIFFENSYAKKREELKNICAREFIFFQMQEKWSDPHYQADLANFIRIFTRDIEREF